MTERFADAATQIRPVLLRPQRQQLRDPGRHANITQRSIRTRNITGARRIVGYQRHVAQPQVLSKALVVPEEKCLVLANRTADRRAENIALELRNGALVEKVSSIQIAVAQKLVNAAVQLIRARAGHDAHLP